MLPNPLLRKLVQISEEAFPSIHVPLILDNDFFILTQQDLRKIEDSRVFIISKILPNGDLKVINSLDAADCLQQLSQRGDTQFQQLFNSLLEFSNYKKNANQACQPGASQPPQQYSASNESSYPQPMEVSMPADTVASINQQLEWDRYKNTSAPFPIHYTQGTSTTDINCKRKMKHIISMTCCNRCKLCPHCENRSRYSDKSTNVEEIQNVVNKKSNEALDAREQLKKKKMSYSLI